MGQYYKPVSLDKKEYMYSHDFKSRYKRDDGTTYTTGEGLKLMEHSYIGNKLMNAVENMIIPGGSWYKTKLVWAGDYADAEPGLPKIDGKYDQNVYCIMEHEGKKIKPTTKRVNKKYHYLTNHTEKFVIDLEKVQEFEKGWKIHPLSLLICEGNGRGGGDFLGEDSRVGTWARDVISLEDHVIDGYTLGDEEDATFREDRG